jgi:hypothetical protein
MVWTNTLSPALRELIVAVAQPPLGPGTPNPDAHARLKVLRLDSSFAPHAVCDRDMAQSCLAGIWLLHNYLDEAHEISQEVDTATGSYWHGILHRREQDFSNAKYWFRRVGKHPVFEPLLREAAVLATAAKDKQTGQIATWPQWDPFAFVDLCADGAGLCAEIQQIEWGLLFEHCYRHAVGDAPCTSASH